MVSRYTGRRENPCVRNVSPICSSELPSSTAATWIRGVRISMTVRSSNSIAARMSSPLCSSIEPPLWTSSTMVSSSSSVMAGSCLGGKNRSSSFFHCVNKALSGVSSTVSTRREGVSARATVSAFCLARHLGEISPKISTTTVITTVDSVTPASLKKCTNTTVAIEAAAMFTILFPIRMVESRVSYCSDRRRAADARLFPACAWLFSRMRFRLENAVSDDEKYADAAISSTKTAICIHTVSTVAPSTPCFLSRYRP